MMIDWKKLHKLVEHKCKKDDISFRQLAVLLGKGSSGSCFTRMKHGTGGADADTFVALLDWLKINHQTVLK